MSHSKNYSAFDYYGQLILANLASANGPQISKRLAHVHPAILRLPGVDRVLRYAHFPRHVFRFASRLQLLQRPDHLRLRVIALRHSPFPFPSTKSYFDLFGIRGTGQGISSGFKDLKRSLERVAFLI